MGPPGTAPGADVDYCIKAGYLGMGENYIDGSFEIIDITPEGHSVIEAIRDTRAYTSAKIDWLSKVKNGLVDASIQGFVSLVVEILKSAHL